MNGEEREKRNASYWKHRAELSPITNRSFKEQLRTLRVDIHELKGKRILVLGPGGNFDFEKGISEAGAELVVALSYSFNHKFKLDTSDLRHTHPNVHPVAGLFQELPIAPNAFDFIFSCYGFPMYARDKAWERLKIGDVPFGLVKQFEIVFKALKPNGETRLYPLGDIDVQAARIAERRLEGAVSVHTEMENHMLLMIGVRSGVHQKQQQAHA